MTKNKNFITTAALTIVLALTVTACVGGADAPAAPVFTPTLTSTPPAVASSATPVPTLGSGAAITAVPSQTPVVPATGAPPLLGALTPIWTNTPAAPAATLTPMPTPNYPATITALAPMTATPPAPGTTTTTGVNPSCKTLVEARALFGVDVTLVGTEPCAYTWTSPDGSYAPVNLAKDWIATTAQSDHIWIDDGNDTRVSAHAATFRMKSLNPGLTVDTQFDLELAFAALPQNNFAALVACHGCVNTHVVPTPSAGVSPCPVINSFTVSTIAGGCLYKSLTTANFVIPSGWKALSGVPATWTMSGTLNNVTQVSLYKQ